MPAKIPNLFKKPLPEKKYRAYLKLIGQTADRNFLESSFEPVAGAYVLRTNLDDPTLKRLAGLAKAIQKNKGALRTVPLALAGLLVGLTIAFAALFMNPLLERTAESALEGLFEAKAEIDSLRLDPIGLRLSIASLSVADRDHPMTNLFQMGRTEFRLHPRALFRGKVYIEEARSDTLTFGTPRTVTGALPGRPAVVRPPKPRAEALPPLVDLANFDAKALLDRERDSLAVTVAYGEAAAAYQAAVERWKGRIESANTAAADLQSAARPLLAVQARNLTTVAAAMETLKAVEALEDSSKVAIRETEGLLDGIRVDLDAARALERKAHSAIGDDLARHRAFIDPSSGAALEVLEPSIREILTDSAERYIKYGRRALEVAEKLKRVLGEYSKRDAGERAPSFRGRDVQYPSTTYPLFRLGILTSDFILNGYHWAFVLKDLSTNPDLVDGPTSLEVGVKKSGIDIDFAAVGDFRSASTDLFSADVSGSGIPVDLGGALKQAGIGSLTGVMGFAATFSGTKEGALQGWTEISLTNAALGSPSGTLAKAIGDSVASVEPVLLNVAYEGKVGRDETFTIRTNIGELVATAMRGAVERYAKQAAQELEKTLRAYVAEELEGKFASKKELDDLFAAAQGDRVVVDTLTRSINAKRMELENRAKAIAAEKLNLPRVDIPRIEPPRVRF